MHGHELINIILGLCLILFTASLLYIFTKKFKLLDFSVILVLVGILFSQFHLEPLNAVKLEPEVVLLIFLPILLFESAFNFDFKDFKKILIPAFWLSTLGLIVSAVIIAIPIAYIFDMDFIVALLFGSVISSTDPIAVLSIFKQLGVPKRLQLLVDAESFLNDGTSVIASKILLSFLGLSLTSIETTQIFNGFTNFIYVFFGGIVLGCVLGYLFSQVISLVKNVSYVEIIITLISAHLIFILCDSVFKVSGIIAILGAGIVMGNYGRTKISPNVLRSMHETWSLLVFITTSIVFLLIGYEINIANLINDFWSILLITILILIARAISVYFIGSSYNIFAAKKNRISLNWLHVANWGGLRGALPLIVLFALPENNLIPKELLINVALGAILFTLVINATTIKPLIKFLKIDQVDEINKVEINLVEGFVLKNLIEHLKKLHEYGEVGKKLYQETVDQLNYKLTAIKDQMNFLSKNNQFTEYERSVEKVFRRYCIQVEKSVYTDLFKKNIIPEFIYLKLNQTLSKQIDNIDENSNQFDANLSKKKFKVKIGSNSIEQGFFVKLLVKVFDLDASSKIDKSVYLYHKARVIGDEYVIKEIEELTKFNFVDKNLLENVLETYKNLLDKNTQTLKEIDAKNPKMGESVEKLLIKFESKNLVDRVIEEFGEEGKVSIKSIQNIKVNV